MSINENSIEILMPPTPPFSVSPLHIGTGTFEYVKDTWTRDMLINMFKAITITETWDFVARDPGEGGFMFSTSPELKRIMDAAEKCTPQIGHSGASFAWTLRHMQFIANKGITLHEKQICGY
jgi:hypothetical protein